MNVNSRITELQRKHVRISHAVELAQKSPSSDHLQVAELKRKKLRLKEEIITIIWDNRLSYSKTVTDRRRQYYILDKYLRPRKPCIGRRLRLELRL